MGDWFHSIVDLDATEADAPALADRVLRWLIDEQIVVAKRTKCILGGDGQGGYAPGSAYEKATGRRHDILFDTLTNGLEVVSTRTVFDNGGLGFTVVCYACGGRFEPPDEAWGVAVGQWYDRSGEGVLACPGCGAATPIERWRHDPPWGFGNLGFTFWNWDTLADEFVSTVGAMLAHRVQLVIGKI